MDGRGERKKERKKEIKKPRGRIVYLYNILDYYIFLPIQTVFILLFIIF